MKNAIFGGTLKGYYLDLASSGGCLENLMSAISDLPVEMVNAPQQADLIFVSGVISKAMAVKLKGIIPTLSRPFFIIKIGKCLGKFNKQFENPGENPSIAERSEKYIPIDLVIEGCPPGKSVIFDKLETFITYIDTTPTIGKTLDKKIDTPEFKP
ncbi:MAG: hypothetical protein ACFFCS_25530 [Candidatus Hodarchaeota archaeon]